MRKFSAGKAPGGFFFKKDAPVFFQLGAFIVCRASRYNGAQNPQKMYF